MDIPQLLYVRENELSETNDHTEVEQRAEEFLQVFKKGAEFTRGLLKENERLRYRVLEVEQKLSTDTPLSELANLKESLSRVEAEKQEVLSRVHSIEQENLDYANRYAEIEAENNLLANLYITTYQLHSTFNVHEIVQIIEEVMLNLVGADQFTLLLKEGAQLLQPLNADSGSSRLIEVQVEDPRVLQSLETGQIWIANPDELGVLQKTDAKAVIPMVVDGQVVGALAIYHLLDQKKHFSEIDEEIFTLLGGHASTALCSAMMRSEKSALSFRQGFLMQVEETIQGS